MTKTILTLTALAASATLLQAQSNSPLQALYIEQLSNSDDSNGSVSVRRWSARGGIPIIKEEDLLIAFGFRFSRDTFDFENTVTDWESINSIDVGFGTRWQVNDRWRLGNYGTIGTSAEEGANPGDSIQFDYISIVEHHFSENFKIGPGVGFSNDIDRGVNLFPIIYISWQINDEWKLSSGPSDVSATGANIFFQYTPKALGNSWIFTTGASFSSSNFAIQDNDGTNAQSAEEELASTYVALSYKLESGLKFSAVGGYHFSQDYTTFDGSGTELSDDDFGGAPYLGLTIGFDF